MTGRAAAGLVALAAGAALLLTGCGPGASAQHKAPQSVSDDAKVKEMQDTLDAADDAAAQADADATQNN
ncbi:MULTISPECIES: hypothetical protein [unclassified Streptomyces]|uniref:hypothetical protein n=1 Tax=unclassified Streptomyces TaxID=2593676 RepID=UPI002E3244B5|nr:MULTISPECIES: hypothetical protein [unclassified Streptomyces]WUC63201.1 hypothetical protein OG861_02665 [Streptomyces sp. NBC_00539]